MIKFKRVVDILMTCFLIFLMSFQVVALKYHEYAGAVMFLIVIAHNILNYRWYKALFKGFYKPARIYQTAANLLLMAVFLMTILSGFAISENFEFLNIPSMIAVMRVMHLSCSYWTFALMGVHVGFHWGMMSAKIKINKVLANIIVILLSGYGLFLSIRSGIFDYMFMRTLFAFLDYEKFFMLVLAEYIIMLGFFITFGFQSMKLLNLKGRAKILPSIILLSIFIIGAVLNYFYGGAENF